MISLTNHDSQWGRSEVVIIYPDIWVGLNMGKKPPEFVALFMGKMIETMMNNMKFSGFQHVPTFDTAP